jgi:hypothetical protein
MAIVENYLSISKKQSDVIGSTFCLFQNILKSASLISIKKFLVFYLLTKKIFQLSWPFLVASIEKLFVNK